MSKKVFHSFSLTFFHMAWFQDLFGGAGTKFHKSDLFINQDEVSIAEILSRAVEEFPSVSFGSYPELFNRF